MERVYLININVELGFGTTSQQHKKKQSVISKQPVSASKQPGRISTSKQPGRISTSKLLGQISTSMQPGQISTSKQPEWISTSRQPGQIKSTSIDDIESGSEESSEEDMKKMCLVMMMCYWLPTTIMWMAVECHSQTAQL